MARDRLYPAIDDKPFNLDEVMAIKDAKEKQKALDDLLIPWGYPPGSRIVEEPMHSMRRNQYTPFEFLDFSDDEIAHHVSIQVGPVLAYYEDWRHKREGRLDRSAIADSPVCMPAWIRVEKPLSSAQAGSVQMLTLALAW